MIQEGIITEEEHKAIAQTITPQEALNKLYQVYLLHTQCRFDTDYDCDGIKNHQDSCEYTYNPSQTDLDNDGIGDSCDNDIDGD